MMRILARGSKAAYIALLLAAPLAISAQGLNGSSLDTTLRLAGLRLDKAMLAGPLADAPEVPRLDHASTDNGRNEVVLIG
jgi:hypothetical protein